MDPMTVGTYVSWALGLASEEIIKGAAGEAVRDAYAALKARLEHWAGSDVAALEKAPASPARQAVVAETVDGLDEDEKVSVEALAKALADRLREIPGPVGIDMSRLAAAEVRLGNVTVGSGTGAILRDASIGGAVSVGDVVTGAPPGKS